MCDSDNDVICSLLEIPFLRLEEAERDEILIRGRPTPSLRISQHDTKYGQSYSRNFKIEWYHSHPWLCGSFYKQRLFCWPCLLLAKTRNNGWVSQGVVDLKNVSAIIRKHESSREHMSNHLNLIRLEANSNGRNGLRTQSTTSLRLHNETVRKNHKLLRYFIDVICYFAKQELFKEKSDGSFQETLHLIIKRDSEIEEYLKTIENILETIQNDLISCMSEHIMETIHNEINEAPFFSVQVFDATDIFEQSYCAVCVRFVNKFGDIKERFLGFYNIDEDRSAAAVYNLIRMVLSPFDYKARLVGHSYDGASVNALSLKSLQRNFERDAPKAVLTNCSAHCLNLVLQDGSKSIKNCRVYFAIARSLSNFFRNSSKRLYALNSVVDRKDPSSDYTWISPSKIVQMIDSEWEGLQIVFKYIIEDKSSSTESVSGAKSYLTYMNDMEFSFLTLLFKHIFDITDFLSDILQENSLDIGYYKCQVYTVESGIKLLRNEDRFDELFDNAALRICSDLQGPSAKMLKLSDTVSDEKASLRALFYEIIDNIVTQIEGRFEDISQLRYFPLADCSQFQNYSDNFPGDLVHDLTSRYGDVFDKQKLITELGVIYQDTELAKLNLEIMLRDFVDNGLRHIFPEVYKLFVLIATIPVRSISGGSCFRRLNDIETYRNSAANEWLSSLAFISVEKELLCALCESEDFVHNVINKMSEKNKSIDLVYKK